jgi:glycosyltransferase involved in cell wall biosynthesis
VNIPHDVAVIIPCHNYAHFLKDAIESILAQTTKPSDILVIDDASNDDPANVVLEYKTHGVRIVRTDNRSLSRTRNLGAELTKSAYLLYLDADDMLAPNYIERCLDAMTKPGIAFAYPDMQWFGEEKRHIRSPEFESEALLRSNFASSNALIRRQAFDIVGGYRDIAHSLEDWDFYKRLIQAGFQGARANTIAHYRIHRNSMVNVHNRSSHKNYCNDAALLHTPITIFTPFAGREEVFDRYFAGLHALKFNPAYIQLHWCNTSSDPRFDRLLRTKITALPFARCIYTHAPLPPLWNHTPHTLIRHRIKNTDDADYYYQLAVVRAFNEAIKTCTTEYMLTLEDDMILSPDTLIQLLQTMQWNTAAVIAPYRSGFFPRFEVWMPKSNGTVSHFKERKTGVQEVGGCGLGCTLFRSTDLRAIAPLFTGVRNTPMQWYDQLTYERLAHRGKILCNWDVTVEHLKTERHAEGLVTHFT